MTPTLIGIIVIGLFAALAFTAIWSRRDTHGRIIAMWLFVVGLPTVAAASVEMLGHHRPMWSAYDLTAQEYHVIAAVMQQDKAIYLYLIDPTRDEPRPLVLPWSNEMANKIQKAMDGSPEGQEGQFILRMDDGDDSEMQVHPIPQPPQPAPKAPPEPGMTYTPS